MATIASLKVNILGDSTGLTTSLKNATDKMQAFGNRMTSIGTMMSSTLTAPIVAFGGLAVKAFTVQEDAVAKLTGALRANGGQAGVTAEEIKQLASELQKVTKFGDEVTISASALLLTFHQIRNVAGEGNDVFNRTVKASQDLASALGTDLQSSVIQLAKALENPKIGLTALARSGTTFTEQQKAMIGALVDSGQQLKAQTMILDVVESQYKGIAEELRKTTGGTIKGALNELGDEMETFGRIISESLIPFINRLTDIVRAVASVDDQTKRFIVIMGGLVAIVGPAMLALGLITKGVVALGIAFTTSTGPIGMLITAIGLLTGAYVLHKMKVSDVVSTTNAFIKNNTDFAKALHANAEEMKAFADESGRTADEIERVNEAFKVMVDQASARADKLQQSLAGARAELYELERSGRGNVFTGYGEDSDRAKELREQIRSLKASLGPLYGFLVKAKDGLDAFKSTTTATTTTTEAASGSIAKLSQDLDELTAQFENAGSGIDRAELAKKIADITDKISIMRSVLKPVTTDLKLLTESMADDSDFSGSQWDSQYEGARFMTAQMHLLEGATVLANETALRFTDSFGAGMANLVVAGGDVIKVLENIGKLLLSSAIQTGIRLLLLGTSSFGVAQGSTGLFGMIGKLFNTAPGGEIGNVAPQSASLSLDGQFQIKGTDLVYVMNRAERSFR